MGSSPLPWQDERDLPPDAVELPPAPLGLHPGQRQVFDGQRRFNVIAAGRRWGKSYFCVKLACYWLRMSHDHEGTSLHNAPVWYVTPTIDLGLEQIEPLILEELGKECVKHHKVQHFFEHENGRRLYLKSANRPDNLKGRGLGGLVCDEISIFPLGIWELVLRPMLVDYKAPCALIGTPVGRGKLYELYQHAVSVGDDWAAWKFETIDNPVISRDEVEKARSELTDTQFRQEFEADWDVGGGLVFNSKRLKVAEHHRGVFQLAAVFGSDEALSRDAHALRGSESALIVLLMHPLGWHVISAQRGFWGVSELVRRLSNASDKYAPRYLCLSAKDEKACAGMLREYQRHHDVRLTPRIYTVHDHDDIDRIKWALQSRLKEGRISCKKGKGRNQLMAQLQDFPLQYSNSELVQALSYFDQLPQPAWGVHRRSYFSALDSVAGY